MMGLFGPAKAQTSATLIDKDQHEAGVPKLEAQDAYSFTFDPLTGDTPLALAQYAGKVLLVVNTASKCGFTGQYDGLEKLYQKYKDRGLVIIGVPSDDFGHQEPGSNGEIASFCKMNYGVSFPMAAKVDVIGDNAHPFYKWARKHFGYVGAPKWNFHKYLVDRYGNLVDYYHSTTAPDNARLMGAIEEQLARPEPAPPSSSISSDK